MAEPGQDAAPYQLRRIRHGFFFSREILEELGGWKFFLLTEDIEFTIYQMLKGERIGYCKDAVFYDEQPDKFTLPGISSAPLGKRIPAGVQSLWRTDRESYIQKAEFFLL